MITIKILTFWGVCTFDFDPPPSSFRPATTIWTKQCKSTKKSLQDDADHPDHSDQAGDTKLVTKSACMNQTQPQKNNNESKEKEDFNRADLILVIEFLLKLSQSPKSLKLPNKALWRSSILETIYCALLQQLHKIGQKFMSKYA